MGPRYSNGIIVSIVRFMYDNFVPFVVAEIPVPPVIRKYELTVRSSIIDLPSLTANIHFSCQIPRSQLPLPGFDICL
jgi:hypothetical protein